MSEIHFGFSYVGHENRILLMMERVGEVLAFCCLRYMEKMRYWVRLW